MVDYVEKGCGKSHPITLRGVGGGEMVKTQMTSYIHQNHCHAGIAVYTGISSMLDAKSERSWIQGCPGRLSKTL